jgi:hypothetical protein
MKNLKTDPIKTVLTISVGFIVVFLISKWNWAIYVSLIIGLIGLGSGYLSKQIHFVWMKLAWLLNQIFPKILLGIFFYLFLFPISLLSKVFGKKDPLILKNRLASTYANNDASFDKSNFERPW